jgi:hypothetical protein
VGFTNEPTRISRRSRRVFRRGVPLARDLDALELDDHDIVRRPALEHVRLGAAREIFAAELVDRNGDEWPVGLHGLRVGDLHLADHIGRHQPGTATLPGMMRAVLRALNSP